MRKSSYKCYEAEKTISGGPRKRGGSLDISLNLISFVGTFSFAL